MSTWSTSSQRARRSQGVVEVVLPHTSASVPRGSPKAFGYGPLARVWTTQVEAGLAASALSSPARAVLGSVSADNPPRPGGLIYHYTGLEGLQGILDKKQLWATDVEYLNDTGEATFGRQKLNELLAMEATYRFPRPEALNVFEVAWRSITSDGQRLFVACFCTDGDLLSQWRGYGRGGYSIGFDRVILHQLGSSTPAAGFFLRDMLYAQDVQQSKVTAIVDQFIANAPPQVHGAPHGTVDPMDAVHAIMPWAFAYADDLYQLEYEFKHPAFQEEHEVRAIHQFLSNSTTEIKVRPSSLGLAPYACLDIGNNPTTTAIREIFVGPAPHQDEACRAVSDLLRWHGLPGVEVRPSTIPFRW